MCYHHRRERIAVTQSGHAASKQPATARISEHDRCFFERNAARLKDFCGADEIDG
jgi:hypothetical protein